MQQKNRLLPNDSDYAIWSFMRPLKIKALYGRQKHHEIRKMKKPT